MNLNEEMVNKINELKERVKPDLVINRVPKKELKWFREWADEEFEGDWGFAFKWICQGYMMPENVVLIDEIEQIKERLKNIENNITTEKDNSIKLGNGRIINRR